MGVIKEIADSSECQEIQGCIQCGVCTGACPLSEYGSLIPRKLIGMVREELDEALDAFDKCLLCGQCQMFCPAAINIREVLLALRRGAFQMGKVPEGLQLANEVLCESLNPYMMSRELRKEWIHSSGLEKYASKKQSEVAYWVGCTASYMDENHRIATAIAEILTKLNEDWALIDEEWCCGMPFRYVGNSKKVREFAVHNVKELEKRGIQTVITGCPTCWYTLRSEYPKLLQQELGFKVMHVHEYLRNRITDGKITVKRKKTERITLHDPCDLARNSMTHFSREIIARIAANFVEMPLHGKDSLCCGLGGMLAAVDEELSRTIGVQRLRQAEAIGAEILVTSCAGCKLNLSEAVKQGESKVVVQDLTELLLSCI
ncbi:MAG: (Fe-S)-binding protein [Promethearchaeota archaeon]